MAKLLVFLCVVLVAMTVAMACKPPGMPCTSSDECCSPLVCNPWANRCTGGPGGSWGSAGPWGRPPSKGGEQPVPYK